MKLRLSIALVGAVALWAVEMGAGRPVRSQPGEASGPAASRPAASMPASRPASTEPATSQLSLPFPAVGLEDLATLVKMSRRAFEGAAAGMPERGVAYRPESLAGLSGTVHLTLRSHGAALVQAESGEMDIAEAVAQAGALLGLAAKAKKLNVSDREGNLGLEFEWLGPREYLDVGFDEGGRWTDALLHAFEPGAEGIGVEFRGVRGRTRPSQIIALNYSPDLALRAAEAAVELSHADKLRFRDQVRYFRFRAYHLWQPTARAMPILLARGAALVSSGQTGREDLDAAVKRMGEYLRYRQNRDGWFSHEYLPTADQYSEGNSATVQMTATQGLAAYAVWSAGPDVTADAKKGVRRSALFLTPLVTAKEVDEHGEAKYGSAGLALDFPGHGKQLELTAKMLLATLDLADDWPVDARLWEASSSQPTSTPSSEASAELRWVDLTLSDCISGLTEGLLASVRDDGRLEMLLDPTAEGATEDVAAAGWAMSALAAAHRWHRKGAQQVVGTRPEDIGVAWSGETPSRIERALGKAVLGYQRFSKEPMEPAAAAALARGLCRAYVCTNDARASDLAFAILDEFARAQVTRAACPWPELEGAINARELGLVGVDTADYVSAVADGVKLAERIGDKERAKRYREVVQQGIRFVLQLEVREEGAFYIRSPRDALGGVRRSPWDNRIRADHCADAVLGLMQAREVLYGRR